MTQISQARVKSKTSKSKCKNAFVIKPCLYCGELYKGSQQSAYCSKYHMECASRRRREALVEALAALMVATSCEVTAILYGVSFQITYDLAYSKAEDCIRHRRKPAQLKLEQLGYVYSESSKAWQLQARLPSPLAG